MNRDFMVSPNPNSIYSHVNILGVGRWAVSQLICKLTSVATVRVRVSPNPNPNPIYKVYLVWYYYYARNKQC